jgi:hypothetical protein
MPNEIARILVGGDPHLSSRARGAHTDYPGNSLNRQRELTEIAEENDATHILRLGDFSYYRFSTLEFREAVDKELEKQNEVVNGNVFDLEGNHDTSTSGMTEYQYYIKKGLIKKPENMVIGNCNLSFIHSGGYREPKVAPTQDGMYNFVFAHDFYKFKDTPLQDYGEAILLDNYDPLFGTNYLIVGHIHHHLAFEGYVEYGGNASKLIVHYLGCAARPDYKENFVDTQGHLALITIYDDAEPKYELIHYALPSIESTFNLVEKAKSVQKQMEKSSRVDISAEVKRLNEHKMNFGNPEDIIMSRGEIPEKYRSKAVELLKEGAQLITRSGKQS